MDNLTHTLGAVAISQLGLNRKTRFATLTLILSANAPDLDILRGIHGGIDYLKYHRGISHSFVGITVLAIILSAAIYGLGRKAPPKPGLPLDGRWLLLSAFLGTGSHLLMDFTNAYGVRPFLPFSGRWYAWDIMPIIDPLLLALLIAGLAVPWLLRLVTHELGGRQSSGATGAVFCLAAMVALWGTRDFAHRRALNILNSRTYSGEVAQRLGALPVALNPFSWVGVVETSTAFHVFALNALDPNGPPADEETFEKPQPSPTLAAAMQTQSARVFLDFARFPWAQVDKTGDNYRVSMEDLRFFHFSTQTRSFVLEVELDKNLQTRSEAFCFAAPGR